MNSLFLLCITFGIVNGDVPVPDELKNHYRLTVNEFNVTGCSSNPYNTSFVVQQCQENGTNLPYCCVGMLKSLNYVANENSFNRCFKGVNNSSYFASCDKYYTDSQVEYGKIFGYVVLGLVCFSALMFVGCLFKKCCCSNRNEYNRV